MYFTELHETLRKCPNSKKSYILGVLAILQLEYSESPQYYTKHKSILSIMDGYFFEIWAPFPLTDAVISGTKMLRAVVKH